MILFDLKYKNMNKCNYFFFLHMQDFMIGVHTVEIHKWSTVRSVKHHKNIISGYWV